MATSRTQTTIVPHTQQPLVTRTYPTNPELDGIIQTAAVAQKSWAKVPLSKRIEIGYKFIVSGSRLSAGEDDSDVSICACGCPGGVQEDGD